MEKLIRGIVEFRKKITQEERDLFAKLASGQRPDALFIACSDSRVVPNTFASTNPGDLFVIRNMGNLVPPAANTKELSTQAAIEFSIYNLKVSNIIVCGHSECGAMQALIEGNNCKMSHLAPWLEIGEPSIERLKTFKGIDRSLSKHNQLSQANVLQQMDHILSYRFVQEKIASGKLRIHGWWFNIATTDVYSYEADPKKFVLIDEIEADVILRRLH
jgi:carbonic anhydrase